MMNLYADGAIVQSGLTEEVVAAYEAASEA
jgi:hypothetical protein